jgi:hypothetical protein
MKYSLKTKKLSNRIHKGNLSNYNETNEMINELLGNTMPSIDTFSIIKGDMINNIRINHNRGNGSDNIFLLKCF